MCVALFFLLGVWFLRERRVCAGHAVPTIARMYTIDYAGEGVNMQGTNRSGAGEKRMPPRSKLRLLKLILTGVRDEKKRGNTWN